MLARLIAIALASPSFACGDTFFECTSSVLDACNDVQTCCDSEDCFFEVDGREFRCDEGKQCDDATDRLRAYCSESP